MKRVILETYSGSCVPESMLKMSGIGARYLSYLENLTLSYGGGFLIEGVSMCDLYVGYPVWLLS